MQNFITVSLREVLLVARGFSLKEAEKRCINARRAPFDYVKLETRFFSVLQRT